MHAPKTTESEEKIITPVNLNDESSDASRVGDRGDEPPDGGLQAWLVVLSGFLVYFATFGLLNSYGTFQAYYQTSLLPDHSPSSISWIGSIQLFLLFIGGVIFGPVFNKYGGSILTVPGSILYVLSIMLISICTEYYQLILAQGVLFGIGDAMLFYPTISSISHYFDRRRGLAVGIIVAGSSAGGIVWPLSLAALFRSVGFPWAMRICGFVCLGVLVPSWFFIKPRVKTAKQPELTGNDISYMFKDRTYSLFVAAMFFIMWSLFIPLYYLPVYGLKLGMSDVMANNLLAILNAGSLVGRVLLGVAADRFGRFNITFLAALSSGILLFCHNGIHNVPGLIVFSTLYGFFSGGLISLQSAWISQITSDIGIIGLKVGFMMAICSFGVLTGSPLGGAILAVNAEGVMDFSGAVLVFGSTLVLFSRLAGNTNYFAIF